MEHLMRKSKYDNKQHKSNYDPNETVFSNEDEEDNDGVDELEINLQNTNLEHIDEDHTDHFRVHSSNTRSASDDEYSYDDNALICTLIRQHGSWIMADSEEEVKENISRRYPTRLRKSESNKKQANSSFELKKIVVSSEDVEDNDGVDESESNLKNTNYEHIDEDHTDHFRVHSSNTRSASDDEDSYNDNALICTLIRQHSSWVMTDSEEEVKENISRRYPSRLRKSESNKKQANRNFELKKIVVSSEDVEDNDGVDESETNLKNSNLEHIDEEHTDEFRVRSSNNRSAKRKPSAQTITSDVEDSHDEDSNDDNALICTLIKTQHGSWAMTDSEEEMKENVHRRSLKRLRKSGSDKKQDKSSFEMNITADSSEEEEDNDGVDTSLCESSGGFIVNDSESISNCDSKSSDSTHESEDALNDFIEYKSTMDKIRKKKNPNMKWDLEGDMLSDFAKDPGLCMRAVCAVYRQQTTDEKESKDTRYRNGRGFSQPDAPRGCQLAEFLTDGDSNGDLNKTVEELEEYDSEGIKRCKKLAKKILKSVI